MPDTDTVKTLLRVGVIVILAACALVVRWVVNMLHSKRLRSMARKLFWTFVGFIALRVAAAYFDSYFDFEVGPFSAVVAYAFNVWIFWLILKLYRRLKEQEFEIHKTGDAPIPNPDYIDKARVSTLVDALLDELKVNIRKTDHLAENMTSHLTCF